MDRDDCPLTPKEYETLLLVMQGCSYKQAAARRVVTLSTVRSLLHTAYQRLGVSNIAQAATLMLREGWVDRTDLLPDYAGRPYSIESQFNRRTANWVPTPAQRLYLDAFDVLLHERSPEAAEAVDFAFGVMCWERGCPDRRDRAGRRQCHGRRARDVDEMLLVMAHGLMRPIPLAA